MADKTSDAEGVLYIRDDDGRWAWHLKVNGRVAAAAVLAALLSLSACAEDTKDTGSSSSARSSSPFPTPTPTRTVDKAAERQQLIQEAEDAVLGVLGDAPFWEGTTVQGHFVSDEEVCVDRTYGPTGGLDGNGGNAGYVVATFPGPELGEPQDGKFASAKPSVRPQPVVVPDAFKDEPGLITRDDLGEDWPLTVGFGALDCRETVIDGRTLQSVTFRISHMQYAVNGTARTHTSFPDIDPIWADDPDIDGLKINIGPLIDLGLERC